MLGCHPYGPNRNRKNTLRKASHKRMALIVRSSAIHAAGCYTTTRIGKGRRIAEYTGPRISKDEADEMYQDAPLTYLFGLGNGDVVIDGHCTAMFINHSCEPNCETEVVQGRVWIKALKEIAAGSEITYDYHLYDGDEDEQRCNCGTAKCRGTMFSVAEVRKRKKAKRQE